MKLPIELNPSAMTVTVSNVTDRLAVHTVQGQEHLGSLYEYQVELVNLDEPEDVAQVVDPDKIFKLQRLLGQTLTIDLPLMTGKSRYFSGIVSKAWRLGWRDGYANYGVTVGPRLWLLTLNRDCRIFQNMTVPDVVKEILGQHDISPIRESLTGKYRTWDCVTQYRESDFEFISRIMAHEGIYYYFEHSKDGHTLVLANSISAHAVYDEFEEVRLGQPASGSRSQDYLETWREVSGIQTDSVALVDYDFRLQGKSEGLSVEYTVPVEPKLAELGIYDYPAKFVQQEDQKDASGEADESESREEGKRLAQVRLEEKRCESEIYAGQGTARWPATGYLLSLSNAPAYAKRQFLVTKTDIMLRNELFRSGSESAREYAAISIAAIDSQTPFRSRLLDKPVVWGPQTARVIGPPTSGKDKDDNSAEIWTDKHGRIRVHFHWDCRDASLEKTSCWVRVAHPWAGKGWGAIHIPRVGNEVVVEFLEGDPDRPLVTGSVYNADNMPPYTLPDNKTQTGIKTRSSKGGNPDNFNEIRFEDKKGAEELHIQAERDMSTHVKRNQSTSVDGDQTITVIGNQSVTVQGKGKSPVHSTTSVTGKHTFDASDTIKIQAPTSITLECGGSSIVMVPGTITFTAGGGASIVLDANVLAAANAKAKVLLDANVLAQSDGGAKVVLDANVLAEANGKAKVVLDANVLAQSSGNSKVVLDGDATMEGTGTATVKGTSEATLTATGAVKTSPAGVEATGTKIDITGSAAVNVTGAMVKIN
jgi:type VI secretion system secreted protein VgrG